VLKYIITVLNITLTSCYYDHMITAEAATHEEDKFLDLIIP